MKRFASCVAAALALAACSPQVYPLYLEVRQPSSSGLDLSRKTMGIVYMDSDSPADSTFDRSAASALARALEEDTGWTKHTIITMLTRLEGKEEESYGAGRNGQGAGDGEAACARL